MGSGASNQVRSRSESATKVEKICSPSLSYDYNNRNRSTFKPAAKENMFFAPDRNVASSQSEIVTQLNHKPFKNQKSEIRCGPSPSLGPRKHIGDTEVTSDNISRHELHQKIKELELALAVSESQKLDLQDQLQALEERITTTTEQTAAAPTKIPTNTLNETLNAKDHHIKKLEADLNYAQTDFQKKTIKLKKLIRRLTKQIFELRHEAMITQMELKTKLNDSAEDQKSKATPSNEINVMSVLGAESNTGHTKIILELSNQISEQGEHITCLKNEVAEKNRRIEKLEAAVRESRKRTSAVPVDLTLLHSENYSKDTTNIERMIPIMGEKHGGYFSHPTQNSHLQNANSSHTKSGNNCLENSHHRSRFQHQTTSLSDSDSDWDEEFCLSQGNRHSAPARSRKKHEIKSDLSTLHASSIRSKTEVNVQSGDNYLSNSLAVLNTPAKLTTMGTAQLKSEGDWP